MLLASAAACGGSGGDEGGDDPTTTATFTVQVSPGPGGQASPSRRTVPSGGTATFTITPENGYSIADVTGCGGTLDGNLYTSGPITADCTVSATFVINTYVVATAIAGDGAILPASAVVEHGGTVRLTVEPAAGHSIADITGCGGTLDGDLYTSGPITADCTVSASFVINTYVVTTAIAGDGAILPSSAAVEHGGIARFTVEPAAGHSIADVTGCGGTLDGNVYTTGPIKTACAVSATFADISYTVSATAGANGRIEPANVVVTHGGTATFTVAPDPGYFIESVSGCGGQLSGNDYVTGPVTAACAVAATFRGPSVSGIITAAPGTGADSDVNDPNAPYASNDFVSFAQVTPNPVILGGYANEPQQGPDGRSFAPGDVWDVYRVELQTGDEITLRIANTDGDLDLYLADLTGTIIDASIGTAQLESLTAAESGEFLVAVFVYSGASPYVLTVGTPLEGARKTTRLSDTFVRGEVMVRFAMAAETLLARRGVLSGIPAERPTDRSTLLRLDQVRRMAPAGALTGTAAAPDCGATGRLAFADADAAAKLATLCVLKRLRRDPAFAAAGPNYLYALQQVVPDDPLYLHQWHYPQIDLPNAWVQSTGAGTVVAVVDSGVYLDHPDLQSQLIEGHDFVLGIPGGNDPNVGSHGTHVAGTIAATTNNGVGVAGVAFDAKLMPLRVCDEVCTGFAVEQAVRYAAGLPNASGTLPAEPADVINLSLGRLGAASPLEQALYTDVVEAGVTVVAAAGNDNSTFGHYPSSYDGVISVGAVNISNQKAFYSNYGSWIDVVAPGGEMFADLDGDGYFDGVFSTFGFENGGVIEYDYALLQGTSMASPHMAGVVALMRAAAPTLTPTDVENLLRNGAITDDLGVLGRDDIFGHGLINANKAVTAAIATGGQPVPLEPALGIDPSALDFGRTLDQRNVTLENVGGPGTIVLGTPETDVAWLSVAMTGGDGTLDEDSETITFSVGVDRSGLALGVHTAIVSFPSSHNTVEASVSVSVLEMPADSVGSQYVLLVDPVTQETRHFTVATWLGDGAYTFTIPGVEPGTYQVVAGSDADYDLTVCGAAESCGRYPSDDAPENIEVGTEDLEDVSFTSDYHPELLDSAAAPPGPQARAPAGP